MKREEKNILTKRKILDSAIIEFGKSNYTDTSINAIAKRGDMSKGIIYHYFKDKDDLYLACIKECFSKVIEFFEDREIEIKNIEKDIKKYVEIRYEFFKENTDFNNIFINALLHPPKHLVKEIEEIKIEFDEYNINYYKRVLANVKFRKNISMEDAIEYFTMFQESFNNYFKGKKYDSSDELFHEHEKKLDRMLNIMLYGIIEEESI